MNVQIISKDGQPEYAVLPYADYQRLVALAEDMADVRAYDAALAAGGETIPHAVVTRLVGGENPLKVWREYRGLSQADLAEQVSLGQSTIAMLETGKRVEQVDTLKKIAEALAVDLDDLTA